MAILRELQLLIESVNLPNGYFLVTDGFKIGFGAWGVSFKKAHLLHYENKIMRSYDPLEQTWVKRSPPIQGTTELDISKYGQEYDRREQLEKFTKNTKKLSKATAEKLAAKAAVEKVMTVNDAKRLLKDMNGSQKIKITLV